MKKIIYTLLLAVLALSFMGCPTVYDDLNFEELVPTPAFIMGDMTAGSAAQMKVDGNVATYTFKYSAAEHNAWTSPAGTISFKVADKKGPDGALVWDNAWSNAKITLNADPVESKDKNHSTNITCEGLTDGEEYTITVTAGRTSVTLAITGKEKVVEAVEPDLSAINATTMAQPGAYILIKGDAWGNATVGKYSFNQKGNDYVAVIPFAIASDVSNGWGTDHYQAWGMIGVGDNKDVKAGEKQFNFAEGALNFDATNNMDFANIVAGSKGVITVTASATGCTAVATVY